MRLSLYTSRKGGEKVFTELEISEDRGTELTQFLLNVGKPSGDAALVNSAIVANLQSGFPITYEYVSNWAHMNRSEWCKNIT